MQTVTYRYQANPISMSIGFLFCAGAAAGAFAAAIHNDRGLIILGLFKLMPQGATIFYLVIAIVPALLGRIALLFLVGSLLRPNVLTLTPNELWVPRNSFSKMVVVLNLERIIGLSLERQDIQQYLHISIGTGRVTLTQSFFRSPYKFSEACVAISRRVAGEMCPENLKTNDVSTEEPVQPVLQAAAAAPRG